ncbi:MAG: Fic family protein [Saprospiraceae bacterium]|nr:Fic family protein [Saprospiraceae bacterium]MCF8249374.1 Fic family protein [Saprospiraceae bacterium]MCF8279028.1 Fic family protein [Bacteroidales bacterium]MCF8311503.1 Fic family protein [Saprospiraceae bacterium]MCF8439993.1 Fic family protein [Saprospiraceae bacterium]
MKNNHFSQNITTFHGRKPPEEGLLVGYGAIIERLRLAVPLPDRLSIISKKHRRYATDDWNVLTPRHAPSDDLAGHLTFALKYEGVELHVLKTVFEKVGKKEIEQLVQREPTGQYSRRLWFLYEWLLEDTLDLPDLSIGNYVDLLNPDLQYPGPIEIARRQRIRNNLPGVQGFCSIIRRTEKLDNFIAESTGWKLYPWLSGDQKDLLSRASAFLLLKDSKASYAIEGETPLLNRALRWSSAIGEAGLRELTKEDLLRLQEIVIENNRFVKMGWRQQGGFVGEHDRATGSPMPDHISAKWQDLEDLMNSLIAAYQRLSASEYDPVLAAAIIAFGFVNIHPFVDGNGRIHRYLIHHVLGRKGFTPKGIIFPISATILQQMNGYRTVLEGYSKPRLPLITWKETADHNVEVLNPTIDLYRYFDATKYAEFLYDCVRQTALELLPAEMDYLMKYDRFKALIDNRFSIPDKQVDLLLRFLQQGKGKLSVRSRQKEFLELTDEEVSAVEEMFQEVFFA